MEPIVIVTICVISICLIVQILIVTTGYKQLRHSQSRYELKVIFYCSFILAFCTTSAILCMYILEQMPVTQSTTTVHGILEFFEIPSVCFFLWSLLATFVMRLYLSFKGSALELSARTVRMFATLLIVEAILVVLLSVGLPENQENMGLPITLLIACSSFLFFILYFVGSIVSVRLFLKRLSQLSQLQCASQRDLGVSAANIELNAKQQKTFDLFAKFLLLFSVAMLSTICLWAVAIVGFEFPVPIDLTINLLCLYLQFAVAQHHYQICCGWPDSQCRKMVSWRERRAIHKRSLSLGPRSDHSVVHSVSSVATPSSTEEQPKVHSVSPSATVDIRE